MEASGPRLSFHASRKAGGGGRGGGQKCSNSKSCSPESPSSLCQQQSSGGFRSRNEDGEGSTRRRSRIPVPVTTRLAASSSHLTSVGLTDQHQFHQQNQQVVTESFSQQHLISRSSFATSQPSLDDHVGGGGRVSPSSIGRRVLIAGLKSGVLRFYGRTHFQEGIWCGVELDTADGKHGGHVQGVQYFDCDEDRGLFAPLYKVTLLQDTHAGRDEQESVRKPQLRRECTFTIDDDSAIGDQDFSDLTTANGEDMETSNRGGGFKRPVAKGNAAKNVKRRSCLPLSATSSAVGTSKAPSSADVTFVVEQGSGKAVNRTFDAGNNARRKQQSRPRVNTARNTDDNESLGILSPTDLRSGVPSLSSADDTFVVSNACSKEDESLGILSPSDMRSGLPSLSTSMTSSSVFWAENMKINGDNNGNVVSEQVTITEEISTASSSSPKNSKVPAPKPHLPTAKKRSASTSSSTSSKPPPAQNSLRHVSPARRSNTGLLPKSHLQRTPRNINNSQHSTPVRTVGKTSSVTPAPSYDSASPIRRRANRFSLDQDRIKQIEAIANGGGNHSLDETHALPVMAPLPPTASPNRSSSLPPPAPQTKPSQSPRQAEDDSFHRRTEMLLHSTFNKRKTTPTSVKRRLPQPVVTSTGRAVVPQVRPSPPPPTKPSVLDETVVVKKLEEVRRSRQMHDQTFEVALETKEEKCNATFMMDPAGDAKIRCSESEDENQPGPDPSTKAPKEAWAEKKTEGERAPDLTRLLESFVENAGKVLQSTSESHGIAAPTATESAGTTSEDAMEVDDAEVEEVGEKNQKAVDTEEKIEPAMTPKPSTSQQGTPRHIQNKNLSKLMNMLESTTDCSSMALSSCLSQDTGIGSMPSSMILSMGASQEIAHDALAKAKSKDDVSMEADKENGITEGPRVNDAVIATAKMISPIEEERSPTKEEAGDSSNSKRKRPEAEENANIEKTEAKEKRDVVESSPPEAKKRAASTSCARSRSREKDSVGRSNKMGKATSRAELLPKERVMPNTDVPSRLKAMLQENKAASEQRKAAAAARKKVPGKWDDIMEKIAEGQKEEVRARRERAKMERQRSGLGKEELASSDLSEKRQARPTRHRQHHGASPSSSTASNLSRSSSKSSVNNVSAASSKTGAGAASWSRSNSVLSDISNHSDRRQPSASSSSTGRVAKRTNSSKDLRVEGGVTSASSAAARKISAPPASQSQQQQNGHHHHQAAVNGVVGVANAVNRSKVAAAARTRQKERSALSVKNSKVGNDQPDVVKTAASSSSSSAATQAALTKKTKEVRALKTRLSETSRALEAMTVTVDFLANRKAKEDQARAEAKLNAVISAKDSDLAEVRTKHADEVRRLETAVSDGLAGVDAVKDEAEKRLEAADVKHRSEIEEVRQQHLAELSALHDTRIRDLTQQDERHEAEAEAIRASAKQEIVEVDEKWRQALLDAVEEAKQELEKTVREWTGKEERWAEVRKALEDQVRSLETEIREQEAQARMKNRGDLQLQAAHKKIEKVTAEVDSLKAVLELKTQEVRRLRNENVRLEEKVEEFDKVSLELKKASAAVEDLKAQIATKNNLERKLSAENRKLSTVVEKEQCEKKRLSMENEELMWRIRQGSQEMLSCSAIEVGGGSHNASNASMFSSYCGPASASAAAPFSSSFSEFSYEHQQMHNRHHNPCPAAVSGGELSCSFTEGSPKSLPPFMAKAPLGPRKSEGDGPRVLEVVEKTESVAWKIEYNEQLAELQQQQMTSSYHSPMLKRKLSPQSPGMGRRVAARSMENVMAAAGACPGSPANARRVKMAPPPTVFESSQETESGKCDSPDSSEVSLRDKSSSEVESGAPESIGSSLISDVSAQDAETPAKVDEASSVPVITPEPVDISSCCDGRPVDIDASDISSSSEIEIFDQDEEEEESGFVSAQPTTAASVTVEEPPSPTTADEVTLADASPSPAVEIAEEEEELPCSSLESSMNGGNTTTLKADDGDDDEQPSSSLEEDASSSHVAEEPTQPVASDTSALSAREIAALNRQRAMSSSFYGGAHGIFSVAANAAKQAAEDAGDVNRQNEEEGEDNSLSVASCSEDF